MNELFKGRKLVVATMHQKEKVIAPVYETALGVECIIPVGFNTDNLGTFSGEIKRIADPFTTAKTKCLLGMEITGCDLGIASEGSFGPHPDYFFAYADEEILIFIDKKNDLEIISRKITTETNFNGLEITSYEQLKQFAEISSFPSHSLILRKSRSDNTEMIKGISDWTTLKNGYDKLMHGADRFFAETDMRAMHNPTRMGVIKEVAFKLTERITCCCQQCNTPGFGITNSITGLPCSACGAPTRSLLSYICKCAKCDFQMERMYPQQRTSEDPMYCDYCNP